MSTTVNKNKLLGPRRIKPGLVNHLLLREEPMEISQNQIDLKVYI